MAARMIPSLGPAEHEAWSHEGEIYYALSKLPDDFTVVHSYKMLEVVNGSAVEQKEADFVIFNRKLGILVIEAEGRKDTVRERRVVLCKWRLDEEAWRSL